MPFMYVIWLDSVIRIYGDRLIGLVRVHALRHYIDYNGNTSIYPRGRNPLAVLESLI